ncbi:MAG: hypothetical protein KatS3mg105_4380 [Gemmatales bacterium]|nr:MAG: hypothetical protein KatS3mg105_4380 [Gemmatales bacterium]
MGLWDKFTGEFIDIIEWTEPSDNEILAYRFPRYNNEIKMGAKLIVREGQTATFVNEGQIADIFPPGTYTLETQNLPILSTLMGWKYGFSSPFKAEVYFIAMRQWTDLKWGDGQPDYGPRSGVRSGSASGVWHLCDAGERPGYFPSGTGGNGPAIRKI